jgi:hypothetical protein
MTNLSATELLLEVARCPVLVGCKMGELAGSHPCASIVAVQADVPLELHQLPEPWSGDLERAPILFVSSNPSINRNEEYPLGSWSDDEIVDFFQHRFGGGRKPWVIGGSRSLRLDGTHSNPTSFWAGIRNRATDLLGRQARPGLDYALIEIVRCKSAGEAGVGQALAECPSRYLRRSISASGAVVIVTLGEKARPTVAALFGGPERNSVFGPVEIGGRTRYLAAIGHPTSGDPKRWEKCIGGEWTGRLRLAISTAAQ